VAERSPLLRLADVEPTHVLDVRAGREGLFARAGQNDHACFLVLGELPETVAELAERR